MRRRLLVLGMVLLTWGAARCEEKPWSVTVSTFGGITGGGSGTTIYSDGRVEKSSWSTAGAPRKTALGGRVTPAALVGLKKILTSADLVALQCNNPHNMTTELAFVEKGGAKRTYKWPAMSTPPAPLDRAYRAVLEAAR